MLHRNDLGKRPKDHERKNESVATVFEKSSENSSEESDEKSTLGVHSNLLRNNSQKQRYYVAVAIAPVCVHYGGNSKIVNALFDDGCNNTNISQDLMNDLKMKPNGRTRETNLNIFTGVKVKTKAIPVKFQVSSLQGIQQLSKYGLSENNRYSLKAYAIASVCPSLYPVDWTEMVGKKSHLSDVSLAPLIEEEVQLVIGTDYPGLLTPLESRLDLKDIRAPTATLTRLGWVLMGPNNSSRTLNATNLCFRTSFESTEGEEMEYSMEDLANKFWELETPQIKDQQWSINEKKAYEKMRIEYNRKERKFIAHIPWKTNKEKPNLPANRQQVLARQKRSLSTSYLTKRGCTLQEIEDIFKEYHQKKYILKLQKPGQDGFYLPYFPVVDRSRTTNQVRVVFDAAAKCEGISLNDAIMDTPNLVQSLLHCMIGFRLFIYAIVGDISQMFNRIALAEKDQPYHRFLIIDAEGNVTDYEYLVCLFGNKASPNISQKTTRKCENAWKTISLGIGSDQKIKRILMISPIQNQPKKKLSKKSKRLRSCWVLHRWCLESGCQTPVTLWINFRWMNARNRLSI